MPDKTGRPTPQEQVFVDAFAVSGDTIYAGTKAGYAQPATGASRALARPAIQAAIVEAQQRVLFEEILPLAITAHKELLTNKATPAGARVQAVKLAYDRTLGLDDAGKTKEPHEMTADELANALDALKRVAADRSKLVIEHEAKPGVFG